MDTTLSCLRVSIATAIAAHITRYTHVSPHTLTTNTAHMHRHTHTYSLAIRPRTEHAALCLNLVSQDRTYTDCTPAPKHSVLLYRHTAPATSTATTTCLRLLFAFTNFQEQRGPNTNCTGKAPHTSSSPSDPHVLCTNLLCTTSRRCGYLCVLFSLSVQRACAVSNRWWELSCKRATEENWSISIFLVPTTGSRQHIYGRTDMCIPVWSRLLGAEVCLWPVLHRGRTLEQRLALVKLRDHVPAWATKKKS